MKPIRFIFLIYGIFVVFLALIFLNGCSNNEAPQPGNFSLSVARGGQMAKTSADNLVITSAKIMVSDLRIKGSFIDTLNPGGDNDDNEVILNRGPFVLSLNLDGDSNQVMVNTVQPGTYYGVKFEIHRLAPGETTPDSSFVDTIHGKRYSVVITGTYNGSPFVFKSTMSAKQMIVFQHPISVTQTGFINVTLVVDPYAWFYFDGHLLNPTDVNSSLAINANIRGSFSQGYKDRDDGIWHIIGRLWDWLEDM
jgi:hypothetical protein